MTISSIVERLQTADCFINGFQLLAFDFITPWRLHSLGANTHARPLALFRQQQLTIYLV